MIKRFIPGKIKKGITTLLFTGMFLLTHSQNITRIEYFFDADPGFGNGIVVSFAPSANVANVNVAANITSLAVGMHQLFVRSQDTNGNWSITNRTFFYKLPNSNGISNISRIEYFFDTDPGFGNGTALSITPDINIASLNSRNTDISGLSYGTHYLFVRCQDSNGNWSVSNSSAVEIIRPLYVSLYLQGYYTENSRMTPALYNENVVTDITTEVDSVDVELHAASTPYSLLYSYKIVLHTDGTMVSGFPPSLLGTSCYIVIRHRNTIETWSAEPVVMSSTASYDFSNAANKAYGNNMVQLENIWALYTGDINRDGNIDIGDFLTLAPGIDVNNGYFLTDLNGDGNVDIGDFLMLAPNIDVVNAIHP